MLVICNGNPKAGRHALVKTVELLGIPWKPDHCISGHWPVTSPPPEGKHIHIIRNPRNMMVSWVRFTRDRVSPGYLIGSFKSYFDGKPIFKEFSGYHGWLSDPDVLTVRFEGLSGDDGETAQQIADFLDVPMLPDVVERRLGGTRTWTTKLSCWQDHWSDEIEAAWVEARGPEIEKMFGYGN